MASFAAPPKISPLAAVNPLQDLLAGLQQGIQLRQLPQQQEQAALQAQLAAALNQAKLAQIQDALANPNRELQNALRLEAERNANNIALEKLRQLKPGFSEALGVGTYYDENGMLRARPVAIDNPLGVPTSASAFEGVAPNLGVPEAPALTFEAPPAQDLNSQLQQILGGGAPTQASTLTGRLAQEEQARLAREEVARTAKGQETAEERKFRTQEREAGQTFVTGRDALKAQADLEKEKAKGTAGGKLSADESKGLVAAASQGGALQRMVQQYDDLAKEGKAGIVGGTKERGKQLIGMGGEDFSKANAEIQGNLFGLARALQGGGVLTEQDLIRMQDLVQPINVERPQFVGSLKGVGQVMIDKIDGFLDIRGDAIPPDLRAKIDKVRSELSSFVGSTGTTTKEAPTKFERFTVLPPEK